MKPRIVSDHYDQFAAGAAYLAGLLAAGRLKYDETVVEGFEQAPVALRKLFTGEKLGKLLVHIADPSGNVA